MTTRASAGGVTDRLSEQGWQVIAINGAARARSANFANRRAELYWALREALNPEGPSPLSISRRFGELARELTEICYGFTSQGRIQVEPKEAIRSRLGRSPDEADALALSFAAAGPCSAPRAWVI